MSDEPFVITISHQVGSGGANLGKALAERLGIPFVDRDILQRVAQQLHMPEREVESREERLSSFWESFSRALLFTDPTLSMAATNFTPSDKEVFDIESEYITRIAESKSAVVLGRCGWYILRNHPCRVSLFLHADMPSRVKRVADLYHLSPDEAVKYIETNDKERAAYIRTFTRQDWLDSRLYDLSIDTSRIDYDRMLSLVMSYLDVRLR